MAAEATEGAAGTASEADGNVAVPAGDGQEQDRPPSRVKLVYKGKGKKKKEPLDENSAVSSSLPLTCAPYSTIGTRDRPVCLCDNVVLWHRCQLPSRKSGNPSVGSG